MYHSTSGRRNRKRKSSFCVYTWYTIRFVVRTHLWCVVVVIFSVSFQRKNTPASSFNRCFSFIVYVNVEFYIHAFLHYMVEKNGYVNFFSCVLPLIIPRKKFSYKFIFHSCTPIDIVFFFILKWMKGECKLGIPSVASTAFDVKF